MNPLASLFTLFSPANPRRSLLDIIFALDATHRERRALLRMDDAQLTDIGLNKRDAKIEAARPVWNAPHHWMR